jgi:hypothetical protein
MTGVTVDDLLARQEIENVIGRLCRAQDRLDRQEIISCYHSDAIDDHVMFRGSPVEFADWFVTECHRRFQETMHFVAPSLIEVDGDVAQSNTQVLAHHLLRAPEPPLEPGTRVPRSDFTMGLRYLDRFERRDGRWLIAVRKCVNDWAYHSLFEGPINGWHEEGMTAGARDRTDPSYSKV